MSVQAFYIVEYRTVCRSVKQSLTTQAFGLRGQTIASQNSKPFYIRRYRTLEQTLFLNYDVLRMMDLFRDKILLKKEYFEKKPKTPEEDTLSQQLNLHPTSPKPGGGKNKDDQHAPREEPERPGRVLGQEVLRGKVVGLYFSAGWCPPCQTFIRLLASLYDELQNRKANFEVVFLSFDKNEEEMEKYFLTKHRDWLALPFDDPFKDELKLKYNVTAIPRFIVIQRDGELITTRGRKEVQDKGVICFRNWQQAHVVHEAKLEQVTQAATSAQAVSTEGQQGEEQGADKGTEKKDVTVTFQVQ